MDVDEEEDAALSNPFGDPKPGAGQWASEIQIIDPVTSRPCARACLGEGVPNVWDDG
jgi:hypothetical protein